MPIPEELQYRDKTMHIGTTTIHIDHKKNMIVIDHKGNIGDNLKQIKKEADMCLGKGMFERLEKSCEHIIDAGEPDYYYTRTMWFTKDGQKIT